MGQVRKRSLVQKTKKEAPTKNEVPEKTRSHVPFILFIIFGCCILFYYVQMSIVKAFIIV